MSDLDYDALDEAVRDIMGDDEEDTSPPPKKESPSISAIEPPAETSASSAPKPPAKSLARKPRGRYLDMIHPKYDMRQKGTAKSTPPAPAPAPKPAPKPASPPPVAPKPQPPAPKPPEEAIEFGVIEDVPRENPTRAELAAEADFAQEPTPFDEEIVPDANNYSLGGKSPFIPGAPVEKRPLGSAVSDQTPGGVHSTKNVYSTRQPVKDESLDASPTMVVPSPKKKSGWGTFFLILLVIILGAALGAAVYYFFLR